VKGEIREDQEFLFAKYKEKVILITQKFQNLKM